ncbi:MAG: helix-turn-helix domain-containing protein [Rhodobacteraceae bacterium]|nr:MAG: helix-turn-helix domain-containing protein [Paracoccaceae bacterium]
MGRALENRDELSAPKLRVRATREKKNRVARRMLAIANAPDGMSRAEAARAAGMDREALRDAVVRYNAEGIDGLHPKCAISRRPRQTPKENPVSRRSARVMRRSSIAAARRRNSSAAPAAPARSRRSSGSSARSKSIGATPPLKWT